MQGLQLVLTVLIATATAAIASLFGGDAWVTALIVASLPFASIRAPAAIQLERTLSYKRLATVEIAESISYYAWAIATVAAGWGVWGLASASLAQACVGSTLMVAAAPMRVLRPGFQLAPPSAAVRFRASLSKAILPRTCSGCRASMSAPACWPACPTLGLWSLASRIMLTPNLLFQALWRVATPRTRACWPLAQDPRPDSCGGRSSSPRSPAGADVRGPRRVGSRARIPPSSAQTGTGSSGSPAGGIRAAPRRPVVDRRVGLPVGGWRRVHPSAREPEPHGGLGLRRLRAPPLARGCGARRRVAGRLAGTGLGARRSSTPPSSAYA